MGVGRAGRARRSSVRGTRKRLRCRRNPGHATRHRSQRMSGRIERGARAPRRFSDPSRGARFYPELRLPSATVRRRQSSNIKMPALAMDCVSADPPGRGAAPAETAHLRHVSGLVPDQERRWGRPSTAAARRRRTTHHSQRSTGAPARQSYVTITGPRRSPASVPRPSRARPRCSSSVGRRRSPRAHHSSCRPGRTFRPRSGIRAWLWRSAAPLGSL